MVASLRHNEPMIVRTPTPEDDSIDTIVRTVQDGELGAWDFAIAGIMFAVGILIALVLRSLVTRFLHKRSRVDPALAALLGRVLSYVVIIVALVYALESLGLNLGLVVGGLGIAGIALAFALQDILENFVAGIILQLRRPFKSGDEILSGDYEGTVLEIDARTVKIRTPDGETIKLPSASVIKNPIVNHHQHGRRRSTVDVGVAYGTDLDVATDAIMSALAGVSGVLKAPAPEVIVNEFGSSSIDLVVRYWHQPSIASQWATRDRATRAISAAFREHTIEIPFPQRVLHSSDPSGSNLGPTTK